MHQPLLFAVLLIACLSSLKWINVTLNVSEHPNVLRERAAGIVYWRAAGVIRALAGNTAAM